MKVHKFLGGIGLIAALALSACGGGNAGGGTGGGTTGGGTSGGAAASTAAGGAAGSAAAAGGSTLTVSADPSGQLKYAETSLSGAANQPISVNFSNSAPVPHNWVLVQPGQEDAVATAAMAKAGDPSGIEGVIAGGKPLTSGTETIQVPATPAGSYTYICTVPGHYQGGMKGTLTLQ